MLTNLWTQPLFTFVSSFILQTACQRQLGQTVHGSFTCSKSYNCQSHQNRVLLSLNIHKQIFTLVSDYLIWVMHPPLNQSLQQKKKSKGVIVQFGLTLWSQWTPWTIACQAPLPMEISRQDYGKGLLSPSPGDLPTPGIKPSPPTSLLHCRQILYH